MEYSVMMPREYIVKKIDELVSSFKNLTVRYAYDVETDFHIVELVCDATLKENERLIGEEWSLYNDFSGLFSETELIVTEPSVLTEDVPTVYVAKSEVSNAGIPDAEIHDTDCVEYNYVNIGNFFVGDSLDNQITLLAA